jgi:NAD(P)-dependent dehydrogenase (short-subunit alcohol dehydrogenase family)
VTDSREGPTVLVTGGTGGIGRATAAGLARSGARVVIGARNRERARAAVEAIRGETGVTVEVLHLDLASLASVAAATDELRGRVGELHALVNNAGVMLLGRRRLSADGFELTLAVNHLGPFLLTTRLEPLLRAGAPARIVNVSSDGFGIAADGLRFDDLQFERDWSGWEAYGASKLCNVYFTTELARRLAGSGVTANALHPGYVDTELGRVRDEDRLPAAGASSPPTGTRGDSTPDLGFLGRPVTAEEGARTSLYLVTSGAVEGVSGRYFRDCEPVELTGPAADGDAARRLWDVSAALVDGAIGS